MVKNIEKKQTYKFFEGEYEFYKNKIFSHEQIVIILNRLFMHIDGRNGYNSQTNANYAKESLNLFLKNKKEELDKYIRW